MAAVQRSSPKRLLAGTEGLGSGFFCTGWRQLQHCRDPEIHNSQFLGCAPGTKLKCLYTVPVNWIRHFDCFDSTAKEQQLTLQLLAHTWNNAIRWTLYTIWCTV